MNKQGYEFFRMSVFESPHLKQQWQPGAPALSPLVPDHSPYADSEVPGCLALRPAEQRPEVADALAERHADYTIPQDLPDLCLLFLPPGLKCLRDKSDCRHANLPFRKISFPAKVSLLFSARNSSEQSARALHLPAVPAHRDRNRLSNR
jgi:hypothetical protein